MGNIESPKKAHINIVTAKTAERIKKSEMIPQGDREYPGERKLQHWREYAV